jgi:hypothetical protein
VVQVPALGISDASCPWPREDKPLANLPFFSQTVRNRPSEGSDQRIGIVSKRATMALPRWLGGRASGAP